MWAGIKLLPSRSAPKPLLLIVEDNKMKCKKESFPGFQAKHNKLADGAREHLPVHKPKAHKELIAALLDDVEFPED